MAKQGQHKNDANDNTKSKGHNNPDKSVTITTGSYKKQETYEQQAYEHQATNKQAQAARNDWNEDTRDKPSIEGAPRDRNADDRDDSRRSGSESNAGQ
jgi:hypothetical protein